MHINLQLLVHTAPHKQLSDCCALLLMPDVISRGLGGGEETALQT